MGSFCNFPACLADQEDREVVMVMSITIGDPAPVDHHAVVKKEPARLFNIR